MLGLTRPLYVEGYFSMLSIRECLGDMTNGALHCCDRCHERKTVRPHLMLIIQTIMVWLSKMDSCGLFQYLSVWFWTIYQPRFLRFLVGASRRLFRCIGRHHRNITTHVPTQTYSKLDLGIDQLSWISLTDSSKSWTEMVGNKRFQGILTSHEWTLPMIFVSHCGGLWYTKTGIRSSGIIQHGPNDFPSIISYPLFAVLGAVSWPHRLFTKLDPERRWNESLKCIGFRGG